MERFGWIKRFVRWLFGAPFTNMPSEFGDTVPPELRVFETEAEWAEKAQESEPAVDLPLDGRSRDSRPDGSLRRR